MGAQIGVLDYKLQQYYGQEICRDLQATKRATDFHVENRALVVT